MKTQQNISVILLGDAAVGKSSLLSVYSGKKFEEKHMATLGLDYVC